MYYLILVTVFYSVPLKDTLCVMHIFRLVRVLFNSITDGPLMGEIGSARRSEINVAHAPILTNGR